MLDATVGTLTLGNMGQLTGCGAPGEFTIGGMTVDAAHHVLYVSVSSQCLIAAVDLTTTTTSPCSPGRFGVMDGVGASAAFETTNALMFDGEHTLYVSDGRGRDGTRGIDTTTRRVSTIAGVKQQHAVVLGAPRLRSSIRRVVLRCVARRRAYDLVRAENAILHAH